MVNSSSTLELDCWIVGDALTNRFLVEIDSNKRVMDLQRAIKEKRFALEKIDASDLVLWEVSIPQSQWTEEKIRKEMKGTPLASTKKSTIYRTTPPQRDHVHIIVWSGKLTLFCWIVGEETRRIFSVTINGNQDIGDLRQAIKKEKRLALANVDASDLVLREVSIPKTQWSEEKIQEEMKRNPLAFTRKLSSIYDTPPQQGHINIIVWTGKLTLNCWIVGEEMGQIFPVVINDSQYVCDLHRAIKKEKSLALENIDASDLVLWEVSIPKSQWSEERIREEMKGNPLASTTKLSSIYRTLPQQGHVHIIALSRKLTLNCWIVGEEMRQIFSVTINDNQYISDLQRAIKKEKSLALENIDASDLVSWEVSIPKGQLSEEKIREGMKADPLDSTTMLSSIYCTPPQRDHVHIIAWSPKLNFDVACWIVEKQNTSRMISVSVNTNQLVSDLRWMLKEKSFVPNNVDARLIGLWRALISFQEPDVEQRARGILEEKQISDDSKWSDIFVISPESGHIHIVVWYPQKEASFKWNLPLPGDFLNARKKAAPSTAAETGSQDMNKLRAEQEDPEIAIHNARPRAASGKIPITLLHPIFADFAESCTSAIPTRDDNELALELLQTMPNLFPYENDRLCAITDILEEFCLPVESRRSIPSTLYQLDAGLKGEEGIYFGVKCENESCMTKSDPYLALSFHYLEANRVYFEKNKTSNSRRPCLFMIIAGSHLSFSGAVWQDRPVIEPLTVAFPLHCHMTNETMRIEFCRTISALKKALPKLAECYTRPKPQPDLLPRRWFPYPCKFTSLDSNSKVYIDYDEPTDKETFYDLSAKLVFFATIRNADRKKVCIKYTRRYSRQVHEACANMRIAPRLLGFESLPGGWIMVVMDRIEKNYISLFSTSTVMRGHLYDLIKEKLQELHQKGMVHGDFCNAKIMVEKIASDKFLFLDFDWAGKIGEVTYPMNVNRADIWRPDDAVDGKLIKAEHDIMMLDNMFGRRNHHL